jgi:hypothetical protein
MNMKKLIFMILVASCLMMTKASNSQITGTFNVKGTVLTRISIVSTYDLDFGNSVLPGIPVAVNKTNSNAGQFSLEGEPYSQIYIKLALPTTLTNGSDKMPISFSSTDGGYRTNGPMKTFDPNSSTTARFTNKGTMKIYLGGKIMPDHSQSAGIYDAPVEISLYYTGN